MNERDIRCHFTKSGTNRCRDLAAFAANRQHPLPQTRLNPRSSSAQNRKAAKTAMFTIPVNFARPALTTHQHPLFALKKAQAMWNTNIPFTLTSSSSDPRFLRVLRVLCGRSRLSLFLPDPHSLIRRPARCYTHIRRD
jgi:hypothetical protein